MRTPHITLILAALISFYAAHAFSQDIKLPERMPELKITEDKKLGTLDEPYGLKLGEKVSNFSAFDHFGKPATFESLSESAPLLVIFYRGGWCPYCNRQIRQLTEAWPEFKKRGVTPVLISADKPDAAALASRTYEIPFPVLSDPKLKAHDAFKVTMTLDADTIEKYKGYGIELSDWSGEEHASFAVSSAFLIAKSGKVKWSHSSLDYAKRPSVDQLLSVIDQQ